MEVRDCVDAALTLTLALSLDREAGKAGRGKTLLADSLVSLRSTGRVESRLLHGHGCRRATWTRSRRKTARPEKRASFKRSRLSKRVSAALYRGMKLEARRAAIIARASCAVAELEK